VEQSAGLNEAAATTDGWCQFGFEAVQPTSTGVYSKSKKGKKKRGACAIEE